MLELTSAIILLTSSLIGSPNSAIAQDIGNSLNTQSSTPVVEPVTLSEYVANYFIETPIMAEIARCESQFRQFNPDGSVLRGVVNKSDLGLLQINEYYHGDKAIKLGLDLRTIDGNLAYAKYLYEKEGSTPWNSSKKCWDK